MPKDSCIEIRYLPADNKIGLLRVQSDRILHDHEMITITKLLRFGYNIVCLAESNLPHTRVADIVWQGEHWEIKNIGGNSKNTIANRIHTAKRQSRNIVLNVTNSKVSIERLIGKVKIGLLRHRIIRKIILIDGNRYCMIDRNAL